MKSSRAYFLTTIIVVGTLVLGAFLVAKPGVFKPNCREVTSEELATLVERHQIGISQKAAHTTDGDFFLSEGVERYGKLQAITYLSNRLLELEREKLPFIAVSLELGCILGYRRVGQEEVGLDTIYLAARKAKDGQWQLRFVVPLSSAE